MSVKQCNFLESMWGRAGTNLGVLDPEGPSAKVIFDLSDDN